MVIDPNKEVQEYGPYQIVLRNRDGKVHGIVWRGGIRLVEVQESNRVLAAEALEHGMGVWTLKRAEELGTMPPTDNQVRDAFSTLWNYLEHGQRRMLCELHRAPGRAMSTHELAAAAGYKGYEGVNMKLGMAGYLFCLECPRGDLQVNGKGKQVPTSWFGLWDEDKHTWTMRPEVADAMTRTNCLS